MSIPMPYIYRVIDGKARIIDHPINSQNLDEIAEVIRSLGEMYEGYKVYIEILPEGAAPTHPAGFWEFKFGKDKEWLLVIAQSLIFRHQIASDPASIIKVAKLALTPEAASQDKSLFVYPAGFPDPVSKKASISMNAAFVALSFQINAYGAAYINHPFTEKIIFLATGEDTVEFPTNVSKSNFWEFITQRRAMYGDFNKSVYESNVNIFSPVPIVQEVSDHVRIEYPPVSTEITSKLLKRISVVEELNVAVKEYHSRKAYATRVGYVGAVGDESELRKMARKVERLKSEAEGSAQQSGESCFIATACMGSSGHPAVRKLRTFRDTALLTTRWGRRLLDAYYKLSPPVAQFLSIHPILRAAVRFFLILPLAYLVSVNNPKESPPESA